MKSPLPWSGRNSLSFLIATGFDVNTAKDLFSYRQHWTYRFGTAPVLPMSREEMNELGWDSCDIIIVTGDAYIDHPSFGMALIGRLLESQSFRVGIISQPDWQSTEAFKELGKPNFFFGITASNMDSMVNRYTSDRRLRHDDAYTPDGKEGKRPDRSVLVYAQRTREAFRDAPVIIGGIEASLRRIAHSAHPGTTDEDMLNPAIWFKSNNFRLDQVQAFLPTPLAIASAMYHTEHNPLKKVSRESEKVGSVRGTRQRRLHKAFLRYHAAENWPILREALKRMGRADLIGTGKKHLVPSWQPKGIPNEKKKKYLPAKTRFTRT